MRFRRKRKTDWLYADGIESSQALNTSVAVPLSQATLLLLPTEYIDQNAQGQCTLLRIVGDFITFTTSNAASLTIPNNPIVFDINILRTQVDDSGIPSQLDVAPFEPPALGLAPNAGGARDFLYTRRLYQPITGNAGVPTPFAGTLNSGLAFPVNHGTSFDLRVKRRLRTGECLVINTQAFCSQIGGGPTITCFFYFNYRMLVGLVK